MAANRVRLDGRIDAIEPMRVSPAGVSSVRFTVRHESVQDEAGHPRKVEVTLRVAALGPLAESARSLQPGTAVRIDGFLARASNNSDWPVLHARQVDII